MVLQDDRPEHLRVADCVVMHAWLMVEKLTGPGAASAFGGMRETLRIPIQSRGLDTEQVVACELLAFITAMSRTCEIDAR